MSNSMKRRVMIDLETLGTDPGAAILSIGAVAFDCEGISDEFYRVVDLGSCQAHGLDIDAATLEWWLTVDNGSESVLTENGDDIETVLESYRTWHDLQNPDEVWANSPGFDCTILAEAMDRVGLTEPWEYYETRDLRTLQSLPIGVQVDPDGNEHNALEDAKAQAQSVIESLESLETIQRMEGSR